METEIDVMVSAKTYDDQQRVCDSDFDNPKLPQCVKCKQDFCPHYASKFDFQFCLYCCNDIILEDSTIKKTIETKSLSGKKTFTRVMTARHLVFKGEDWMFAQQRVVELSDIELATTIEYHRTIFGELVNEMEARKVAHNKKNLAQMVKGSSLKIPSVKAGQYTDGTPLIGMDSTTVTTTTVKRTRITATQTNSAAVAMGSIKAMFEAQGFSPEQVREKILAMLSGGK